MNKRELIKTFLLVILMIGSFNLLYSQNKTKERVLRGQVKVIINKIDTISPTDKPTFRVNKELCYDAVDSIGHFNISGLKELIKNKKKDTERLNYQIVSYNLPQYHKYLLILEHFPQYEAILLC